MYFYQIEREILALVINVKFPVRALFAFRVDICLDAGRDIGRAYLFCLRRWSFWDAPDVPGKKPALLMPRAVQ